MGVGATGVEEELPPHPTMAITVMRETRIEQRFLHLHCDNKMQLLQAGDTCERFL
jgi:hypothetical protein